MPDAQMKSRKLSKCMAEVWASEFEWLLVAYSMKSNYGGWILRAPLVKGFKLID